LYSNSYTSKITSGTVLALLALSGFAVVLAVPISSVKAVTTGSGTLTLSASAGVPVWNSYYKDFGTWVTVTGTGFPSAQTSIQIVMIPSTATITATVSEDCNPNDICDLGSNTYDNTVSGAFNPSMLGENYGTVLSDANGWFKAQFAVPVVQGGSYLVYAIYPTSTGNVVTTTVPFTVQAAIYIVSDFTGTTSSGSQSPLELAGVGFNNGEQIQPIPSSFFVNALHPTITTGVTPGVNEGAFEDGPEFNTNSGCGAGGAFCVGQLVGGSHTLTILGLSSGTSATQTFTITPELFFMNAACANPILSIDTGAGAKVCAFGTGFAKSATVAAAGTATIGGVSTIHGEIDSDVNGNFQANTVITLAQSAGVGALNVVLGGTTFSYANGNIFQPNVNLQDSAAGVLIGSHAAQGALITLPEGNTRRVGQSGAIIGYGYAAGLTYANTGPFVLHDNNGHSYNFLTPAAANGGDATDATGTDANGAFMYWYTTPTMQHFKFTLHDNTAANPAPDSTYTITPDVRFWGTHVASAGDYVDLQPGVGGGLNTALQLGTGVGGFGVASPPAGDLTVYINGNLWDSCNTNEGLCDGNIQANGQFNEWPELNQLGAAGITSTDLPMGSYNVNVTGTYNGDWAFGHYKNTGKIPHIYEYDNALGTVTQLTIDPIALKGALSITSGSAGTTVALETGAISGCGINCEPGIHGLAANTQYNIMWDTTTQV